MIRTRRLVLWSAIGVIAIILAGAVVRASGSGYGCPHWPACFEESFFPPTSDAQIPQRFLGDHRITVSKAWTEWINRLIGSLGGLVILAATISAWTEVRNRRLAWLITAAGLLTAFQAWQGARVVKSELDPRFVTVHLLIAIVIFFMLLSAWLGLRGGAAPDHQPALPGLRRLARFVLGLGLAQFLFGALVRGTIDVLSGRGQRESTGALLDEVGAIDWLHRGLGFALMVAVFLLGLRLKALASADHLLGRAATAAKIIVVAQLAAGLLLVEQGLSPAIQVIHVLLGCLLMAALYLQDRLLAPGR
ncbi:MAG: COX15/CtaA family protein [Planctomycetes bacterium]|nr:COX15/CtaA family protein [Planctomycetota bacterium]